MNTIFPTPITREEELKRALAKIYAILVRLAEESQGVPKPSIVDSKENIRTLPTEYPPEV